MNLLATEFYMKSLDGNDLRSQYNEPQLFVPSNEGDFHLGFYRVAKKDHSFRGINTYQMCRQAIFNRSWAFGMNVTTDLCVSRYNGGTKEIGIVFDGLDFLVSRYNTQDLLTMDPITYLTWETLEANGAQIYRIIDDWTLIDDKERRKFIGILFRDPEFSPEELSRVMIDEANAVETITNAKVGLLDLLNNLELPDFLNLNTAVPLITHFDFTDLRFNLYLPRSNLPLLFSPGTTIYLHRNN